MSNEFEIMCLVTIWITLVISLCLEVKIVSVVGDESPVEKKTSKTKINLMK